MKKRAAIELSMNFLVVIIIGIIILVFSFALFRGILVKTGETTAVLDDRIKKQIEDLLMHSGERVVLPINRDDVFKGDMIVFGLGVTNVLGSDKTFYVDVECDDIVSPGHCYGVSVTGIDINTDAVIKNIERKIYEIVVDFDKKVDTGMYVFNVNVCYNPLGTTSPPCSSTYRDFYGRKYKMYVNVK